MINRKRALIAIILLGSLIIAVIIYLVWFKKAPGTPTPGAPGAPIVLTLPKPEINTSTPGTKPRDYQKYDISKEPIHTITANDLGKVGMTFAERIGSFSKQSNYGNIEDAKLFMTPSLRTWADTYALKLQADNKSKTYYDIATKALSFKVVKFDDQAGTAVITVKTTRKESTEAINNGVAYLQDLTLNFVRVNDNWLVDAAYWGTK